MCDNENVSGARRINLYDYLKLENFSVPVYQRDFVWNKDQIIEFLDEFFLLFETSKNLKVKSYEMFIGSIYISRNRTNKTKKEWEIIDGQQRTVLFYFLKLFFYFKK